MKTTSRKCLAWLLSILFILAMIMGTGPGVLLVNRSTSVFGVPLIYAWAVLWYLVESGVVIAAYLFIWRRPDSVSDSDP